MKIAEVPAPPPDFFCEHAEHCYCFDQRPRDAIDAYEQLEKELNGHDRIVHVEHTGSSVVERTRDRKGNEAITISRPWGGTEIYSIFRFSKVRHGFLKTHTDVEVLEYTAERRSSEMSFWSIFSAIFFFGAGYAAKPWVVFNPNKRCVKTFANQTPPEE